MICLPYLQWPWYEPDDRGKQDDGPSARKGARKGSLR